MQWRMRRRKLLKFGVILFLCYAAFVAFINWRYDSYLHFVFNYVILLQCESYENTFGMGTLIIPGSDIMRVFQKMISDSDIISVDAAGYFVYCGYAAIFDSYCEGTADKLRWWERDDMNDKDFFEMNYCNVSLGNSREEDISVIVKNYPVTENKAYIRELGLNDTKNHTIPDIPVLVVASDYRYYLQAMRMFRNVNRTLLKAIPDMKIIFYDLGLSTKMATAIKDLRMCEVRRFPYEKFPPELRRLKEFQFKPVVIQYALKEYQFVIWADTSIRFRERSAEEYRTELFKYALEKDMLFMDTGYFITFRTNKRMFKYLKEPPCAFWGIHQMAATFLVLPRNRLVKLLMDRWVSCALNRYCMAPPKSWMSCGTFYPEVVGSCHKYDQSYLALVAARLYHSQFPLIPQKLYYLNRKLDFI